MIKKGLFLFSAFALINANALDINEAVNLALQNNNQLKEQVFIYDEAKENVQLNKSSFKPKLDLSYNYYDRNEGAVQTNSTASLALSYNLFNGLKDINSVKSADFLAKSSKLKLKAFSEDIAYNTKNAYISYLDKRKNEKTNSSAYLLFEKQYEDSKNRFEQGLIARNDLLDVQVKMLNAKQNLTRAKSDLKISKYELSNILGGIELEKESIKDLGSNIVTHSVYSKTFLDSRSEIEALKMNINSLNSNIKVNKGDFLPTLDAKLSYNKFGDDVTPADDIYDNQHMAQVTLNWNLYNGGKKYSQIDINKIKIRQVKQQLAKTKLDIKLQYQKALADFEVSKENLESSKLALEQAKENYAIVSNKYDEGLVQSTDLTDANYLLTNSTQLYFKAYYDKFLAIAKLDRVFEKGLK